MPSKDTLLQENMQFLTDVKNNLSRYMDFLGLMTKFHKYALPQQINLFFHAPESTMAVASEHVWNDILGWKLMDNAPYIEILNKDLSGIDRVYDVRYTGHPQTEQILWQYEESKHAPVINTLFPSDGDDEVAERVLAKFQAEAKKHQADFGIDAELLALSSAYIVLGRLGYDAEEALGMQILMHEWQDFDAERVLSAANELSGNTLKFIEGYIKQERDDAHERNNAIGDSIPGTMGKRQDGVSEGGEASVLGGTAANEASESVPDELSGGIPAESRTDGEPAFDQEQSARESSSMDAVDTVSAVQKPDTDDSAGISIEGNQRTGLTSEDINLDGFDFDADMSTIRGKRAVFKINLEAIRLAKRISDENRAAFPNELKVLKNYRGFGGLSEAFDEYNHAWKNEYQELRDTLTSAEYSDIKGSVLNAHFTSPEIIQEMYYAIEKMGFRGGNILEPATGSGRFFESMPEDMKSSSHLFGIELDSITSKIAALAHPEALVLNKGFEESRFANNSFDVAISNVPFGDYKMRKDLPYRDKNMLLHDYFIAKMIDQVRPGGIVAAITSSGTLDKLNNQAREYMGERAELLGAFRLPYTAFKGAGTSVTTDILFFKKREQPISKTELHDKEKWIASSKSFAGPQSNYYIVNPDNVLGEMRTRNGQHGFEWYCDEITGTELGELLHQAIEAVIPGNIYTQKEKQPIPVEEHQANGMVGLFYENGHLVRYMSDGSRGEMDFSVDEEKQVLAAIHLRDAAHSLLTAQRDGCNNIELKQHQENLNKYYEEYVKSYGRIQEDNKLKKIFFSDPSYPLLRSLEVYDHKKFIGKADIFSKRTINPAVIPEKVDNAVDALKISMNDKGKVDLEFMSHLTGESEEKVIEELEFSSIYYDPGKNEYQLADEYLSGDIRQKLEDVQTVIDDLQCKYHDVLAEAMYPGWDSFDFVPKNNIDAFLYEGAKNRTLLNKKLPEEYNNYLHKNYDDKNLMLISYANNLITLPLAYKDKPELPIEAVKLGKPISDKYYIRLFEQLNLPPKIKDNIYNYLFVNAKERPASDFYAPVYQYLLQQSSRDDVASYNSISYREQTDLIKEHAAEFDVFLQKYRQQEEALAANNAAAKKIRNKLQSLKKNYQALERNKPEDLGPADISVGLGTTWLEPDIIKQFLIETLEVHSFDRDKLQIEYSPVTGEWRIANKSFLQNNTKANNTYGTSGASENGRNALELCELALNLREPKIYDTVEVDGTEKRRVNQKATLEARIKQQDLKEAFKKWLWQDKKRTAKITAYYNRHFNNIKPREYNGDFLTFPGMSADITLKKHQKDAIAHTLYGGNTLLAHCVGAGKTFEMIASAMESKRLGLSHKPLIIVPKQLTEQVGEDFQKLYPGAKVLVATDKTFTAQNRQEFCSKIATQDWDAIVMGYTQFEKIPLSAERQKITLQEQINEVIEAIQEANNDKSFSVKQMQKMRKKLEAQLLSMDKKAKDQTVVFEDLGIDRLYVDEAHYFKNLYTPTKLGNVSGVQTTEAAKTMDFYQKCRYINEITNYNGLIFATGTPISNSMTEMYTMQRYLQPDRLNANGMGYFDSWASTFGEQVTEMEINPEGQGFRERTRFAKFQNLPELMSMFKEIADIKTADMLNLPVPEEEIIIERLKPTPLQKEYVDSLADRAKLVRDGLVESDEDNMLKITNEGRLLALDQRIMLPDAPDTPDSKVNRCIENVLSVYHDGMKRKATQIIFCDKSTPTSGKFNVYVDIKQKLIRQGIPEEEIAFIHDANTDSQKAALFEKVRKGQVRILLGSTDKLGTGTNVQDKLAATHDLDVPWKPSDLEQRKGRITRQGNENSHVKIFRYITEGTFDAYMWQILENKQRFISQIMTSKAPSRTSDDCDEVTLSYAEVKACATGNPLIREKMDLDNEIKRLEIAKSAFLSAHDNLLRKCQIDYPLQIKSVAAYIDKLQDMKLFAEKNTLEDNGTELFALELNGKNYVTVKEAGEALLQAAKGDISKVTGHYKGLSLSMSKDFLMDTTVVTLSHKAKREFNLSHQYNTSIDRLKACISDLPEDIKTQKMKLEQLKHDFSLAQKELEKPFEKEALLKEKLARQKEIELAMQIMMDKEENTTTQAAVAERLAVLEGLFDEDGDFDPQKLPQDELARSCLFKAAYIYLENGHLWDTDCDEKLYSQMIMDETLQRSPKDYTEFDIIEMIQLKSPSIPNDEAMGKIVAKYSNEESMARFEEYSDAYCAAR